MAHEHAAPGLVVDLNTFGGSKSTAVVKAKTFEVIRIAVKAGKPIPESLDTSSAEQRRSCRCYSSAGSTGRAD